MYSKKSIWAAVFTGLPVVIILLCYFIAKIIPGPDIFMGTGAIIILLGILPSLIGLILALIATSNINRDQNLKGYSLVILSVVCFLLEVLFIWNMWRGLSSIEG